MNSSHPEYTPALRFNWLTPFYDFVVGATTRERTFKKALIHQAGIGRNHTVLDLGCGTGTLAVWAKEHQPLAYLTGIDGDPAILSLSRRKTIRHDVQVQLVNAMSYNLPFAGATFDRVLSSLFFHHLTWENKKRTAEEIFRVVKPGGEIHIADWGQPTSSFMRILFLFIQVLDGFRTTRDNVEGRLPALFLDAGFTDVKQRKSFNTVFGTMTLYSATKRGEPG